MAIPYGSNYDGTISFSDVAYQIALSANTEQNFTVAGNATQNYVAEFSFDDTANVFIAKNNTAAVPAGGTTTTLQYVELRPTKRYVKGGDVLSFIAPATAYVGVSIRAIP